MPAVVIGIVAATLTGVGLQIGRFAGKWLGPWMERVGGFVLIGIGVRIVLEHTLGL
jgi:putative Mn2+ efflux pump MntP